MYDLCWFMPILSLEMYRWNSSGSVIIKGCGKVWFVLVCTQWENIEHTKKYMLINQSNIMNGAKTWFGGILIIIIIK